MARGLTRTTAGALLLALAVAITAYTHRARPDIVQGGAFLFSDEGHNLLVAAELNRGGQVFQDVYTPYGPATAWLWAATARLAGNTPVVYGVMVSALNIIALLLLFVALCRFTTAGWALMFAVICIVPTMVVRGVMLGGYWPSPYIPMERVVIAGLLVIWRAPFERSWKRSLIIGLCVGSLQWMKFGTAVMVMAAVLTADAIAMRSVARARDGWRHAAMVLAGAAAAEGALVAWAVLSLSWPVAKDVLWPAFLTAQYTWVTPDLRWPPFAPLVYLFRRDAAMVAGALLGAFVLWRHRRSPAAPIIALLLEAYVVGAIVLFRHVYHFYQYAWLLAAAAAFAACVMTVRTRVATLACCAPVLLMTLRSLVAAPPPGVWVPTPAAGQFYLSHQEADDVQVLNTMAETLAPSGEKLLVGPHASGWHAAFNQPTLTRQTWFMTGFVRPWESAGMTSALNSVGAIIACGRDSSLDAFELEPEQTDRFAREFSVEQLSAGSCRVLVRASAHLTKGR